MLDDAERPKTHVFRVQCAFLVLLVGKDEQDRLLELFFLFHAESGRDESSCLTWIPVHSPAHLQHRLQLLPRDVETLLISAKCKGANQTSEKRIMGGLGWHGTPSHLSTTNTIASVFR